MPIRLATPADFDAMVAIRFRGWKQGYRGILPDAYLDELPLEGSLERRQRWTEERGPDFRTWVVDLDGKVAGFCDTGPTRDEDLPAGAAEVWLLYVDPDHWGGGAAGELFEHSVLDLQARNFAPLVLWALQGNRRARRFYERNGWYHDGSSRPFVDPAGQHLAIEVRYRLS